MNTNNELKPGDRVWLTGWNDGDGSYNRDDMRMVFENNFSFPCDGKVSGNGWIEMPGEIYFRQFRFTYEKIKTDGNG